MFPLGNLLVESETVMSSGMQSMMEHLSSLSMAAEEAAAAVATQTDFSSSQASESSNYSLYGTLALVRKNFEEHLFRLHAIRNTVALIYALSSICECEKIQH